MTWDDVSKKISIIAPGFSLALNSELEKSRNISIKLLCEVLGVNEDPDEVLKSLNNSESEKKVSELEGKEIEKIIKILATEKELIKETQEICKSGFKFQSWNLNLYILAYIAFLGFYLLVFLLLFIDLPKDSSNVIFTLFGGVVSAFSTIVGFFFGSSVQNYKKIFQENDPDKNKSIKR